MILEYSAALRFMKVLKIHVPPTSPSITQGEQQYSFSKHYEGLGNTTTITWMQDDETSPPYNLLVRRETAGGAPSTEFYALWAGFAQAYGIRMRWQD
jgi:hypothetical protein